MWHWLHICVSKGAFFGDNGCVVQEVNHLSPLTHALSLSTTPNHSDLNWSKSILPQAEKFRDRCITRVLSYG